MKPEPLKGKIAWKPNPKHIPKELKELVDCWLISEKDIRSAIKYLKQKLKKERKFRGYLDPKDVDYWIDKAFEDVVKK